MARNREEMLIEANRRGLLTGVKKAAFDEAVKRGLIQSETPAMQFDTKGIPIPEQRRTNAERAKSVPSVGRFALKRFVDNFLNIPNASGELLASGAAAAETLAGSIPRAVRGDDLDVGRRFSENVSEQREAFPASLLIDAPRFDSRDVRAAGSAVSSALSGDFDVAENFESARERALESDLQAREDRPGATAAGDVVGDVVTLVSGRAPLARGMRNRRLAQPPVAKKKLPPGFKAEVDRVVNSKIVQSLKKSGLKIGEAGLEGAVIAALNDEDPLTTAALAGGAQAAGSGALKLADFSLHNPGKAMSAVIGGGVLIQMFKEATPGGRDRILESIETAAEKTVALVALGFVSGAAGLGRVGGKFADNVPIVADGITAMPRGAMISLLSDFANPQNASLMEPVIFKIADDPTFFGPTATRRITRAINSENLSVADELDNLMKDRRFRQKVDSIFDAQAQVEKLVQGTPTIPIRRGGR